MSGYSKTALFAKLGLREGFRAHVVNPPANYWDLIEGAPDVTWLKRLGKDLDFVHLFAGDHGLLTARFPKCVGAISYTGMVWVSWPKKSSGVETDEAAVRDLGLALGLVDVKICAVDETWSGLKFVYRTSDRKV